MIKDTEQKRYQVTLRSLFQIQTEVKTLLKFLQTIRIVTRKWLLNILEKIEEDREG